MARPVYLTVSSTATPSPVHRPNLHTTPFNIGLGAKVSGTPNYTVQHTFDDVFAENFSPGTATWFPHANLESRVSSADGNYAFPVQGIRVIMNSGSGSVDLVILQAGIS
jgi:hypothetical protein